MSPEPCNTDGLHKCRTIFIPDLPSESDSFETNRAYKRIVSAIVEIVSSTNNDGLSIGVEGSWGAGKTTIINLLRDELRNSSLGNGGERDIRVIAFDAWAHEGDPLRLTFLETLKNGVVDGGWVEKDKWDEQLEIISGRKNITDTASDYGLTWFDYIIALSFFLIPIGVALLQAALRNEITLTSNQPIAWKLLLGLLLCLAAPFLVLGKLWWRIFKAKRSKSLGNSSQGTSDSQTNKQWFLALLLNRTLSAGRTVVVNTPEPTSTEFEKKFKELMSEALAKDQQRRIVLVIDNLDRVQRPQAVDIWSTLQTFLQHRHYNPPEWLRQLYTIVLYDPKRIGEQPTTPDNKTASASYDLAWHIAPGQPAQEQSEGSFLDKSFQIRFEVPPPILSDWRSYLLDLLNVALPQHSSSEYHDIYRVLAVERHRFPPTIRELKVYVNQISAIHLQWEDSFPLSHVAYFVRLKRRKEEIVAGLFAGRYPEHEYSGFLEDSVRDSLASLSFNVEPHIAYQILLGEPIQKALRDSSGVELKNLAATFENGFWEALESIVSTDWAGEDREKLGVAILAVDHSGVLNDTSRAEVASVQNSLSRIALDFNSWKPFNPSIALGISIVCQWSRLNSSSDELVRQNITQLFEAIAEGLFDRDPVRKSVVPVMEWLQALDVLVQRNHAADLPEVDHLSIIVTKIQSRLENCDYVEAEEIGRLLELLLQFNLTEPLAGDTLRQLTNGGQILHYFNYAHTGSRVHGSCAWCILTYLCFASSIEPPPNVGNAVHGYIALLDLAKKDNVQDVQEFSKLLIRYKDTLTPIVLERGDVLNDFLPECLKHIADGPSGESFFTTQFILKNWTLLARKVNALKKDLLAFDRIMRLLANIPGLTEEIQRTGFKIENVGLYRPLVELGQADASDFRNWCREHLEKLSAAVWESDMQGREELVHFASALRQTGTSLNLGDQYQSAILTTLEHVLTDTHGFFLFEMGFLLDPLEDSDRESVCKKVYERVQLAKGEFPPGFFSSFGNLLLKVLRLDQQSVSSIFKPIVESRDELDLSWLTRILFENPRLLQGQADPQAVRDLEKIVQKALSQPTDSVTPVIQTLAATLRIENIKDERG